MSAFLAEFHWLRPLWLLAIIPAVILLISLLRSHFQSLQWHKHISPELLPALLDGNVNKTSRWVLGGVALCWLAACMVLAGPVWQKQPTPVVQNTQALVIAWDLSPSMLAQDISPSRLERSRLKIIDLLKTRKEGQTALIAYSGEAYTVTPLTDDMQTIINLLPALGPTTLPSVGSNPEMAFEQATELLNQAGIGRGQILLLTDEITPDAIENLRYLVESSPHQLTLWGIGQTQGAPIPLPQGGFAKDGSGNMVLVKLNEGELRQFATETRSYYVPMVTDSSDINALEQLLSRTPSEDESANTEQFFDQWVEYGHYLIWACLPLLALGFRRGWLMAFVMVAPLNVLAPNADASPLQTPDQQGFEAYQKESFDEATELFDNSAWKGAAFFRNGDYESAAREYAKTKDATGFYNLGNAELLQLDAEAAIDAYEQALALQPDHQQAKQNLALARALKAQQEQQANQQQAQDQQENQDADSQQKSQSQDSEQSQKNDRRQGSREQNDLNEQQFGEQNESKQMQQGEMGSSSSNADGEQALGSDTSEGQSSSADAAQLAESASSADDEGSQSSASATIKQMEEVERLTQLAEQQPQTEEQQRLEQALRKVPDDPAGLLRNKFNYQYRLRQQELRGGANDQSRQAEQRW